MALWIGLPLSRSQTTTVSRWLVMPIAARSEALIPALLMRFLDVQTTVAQISSGSCSTQPDFG
jgi:hypothetical protein